MYEAYKEFSLLELMMLFHLHKKEAHILTKVGHPKAEQVNIIAESYLELLDIRVQLGADLNSILKVDELTKEVLESFLKTRTTSAEKVHLNQISDLQEEE